MEQDKEVLRALALQVHENNIKRFRKSYDELYLKLGTNDKEINSLMYEMNIIISKADLDGRKVIDMEYK